MKERENMKKKMLSGILSMILGASLLAACKPIADEYAAGDLAEVYQQILDLAN